MFLNLVDGSCISEQWGFVDKGKVCNKMCHGQKEARKGVVREGQVLGSSEEDESRIVERTINVNNGSLGAIEVRDVSEIPQQQPRGSMIRWDRFLPFGSIKVLLVENDDSTRHVVSALLQNCCYEVMAVSNGLQAWKVLEDLTNHIDIVLTEENMPVLSGIDLLCKIMNHKTLKNIPVIMMSSHDSISLVFKCLSKGAVDFLVKPIRKNELKNLWQHVWRRCPSSSGSGSESGTQSKKSIKSTGNDKPENYAASSDEHDNQSDGLIICDGSENGSGTQSSWTKRAAEAESSQPMSSSNQLPDAPDITCAQAVHVKWEKCGSLWACVNTTKECQELHEQVDDAMESEDLEVKRNPELQFGQLHENLRAHWASIKQNGLPEAECQQFDSGPLEHLNENITGNDRTPNIISASSNCINQQADSRDSDTPGGLSDVPQIKDGASHAFGEILSLELTLKRLQGAADSRNAANDEHNVLRHSDSSAFSKYSTASSANQAHTGNVGSCSPLDNSSVTMKTETVRTFLSHSNGILLNQPSIGSSNKNDMTTTAKCVSRKPETLNEKPGSISAFKRFHSSSFQPMQNGHICSYQEVLNETADDTGFKNAHLQSRSSYQVFHVQHQCHLHQIEKEQHHLQPDHDSLLKIMAITARQCRSSDVFEGPSECNIINYSVNGSVLRSNHGTNGPNGSSSGLNAETAIMESDNGAAGAMSGRSSGSGADEDRVAQRVAALTKFRQKRKERCFEKRVRYQSRKKLAEQRPRVKGQFVRLIVSDSEGGKDCLSNGLASEDNSSDSVR
ncbi:two-component response regulator-like APRR3 [Durio zibethinus]|uniref:Two-component response regulator-like APRR3 n=1 Tax=Durio zibethinus TaxID=66656 RepID=A0A6P5XQT4_DURZI|nr:two-component response regulator-like APRR3 [Durio zibethinus]